MSGLNPLAALGANAGITQAQIQAIDLGVAIEILQQQLTVGDLLTATVLPAQGGTDLLQLFGTSVIAQLPPGINPGQSLLLQVTGFQNNQILVQNLGVVDPENPPATVTVVLPENSGEAPPQQAVVTTYLPSSATSQPNAAPTPLAPPSTGSIAPPSAVFVAASVQPSPALAAAQSAALAAAVTAEELPPAALAPPGSNAPPAASAPPAPLEEAVTPAQIVAGQTQQLGLEARIAATRAASVDIADLVRMPGQVRQPGTALPAPLAAGTPARTPVPTAPPLVTARPTPAVPAPVAASARPLVPPSPESALLDRLRIPIGTLTLAAAKIAGNAAAVLPRAIARLETLLAGVASQDGRAASLRTLLNFAGRLDPGNARALPEQLAAFVNNFVAGPESKLATMIRAFLDAEFAESGASANEAASAQPGSPAAALATAARAPATAITLSTPGPAPGAPQPGVPVDPTVAARVAERAVAMQYDAKATIGALLENPPRGATPELTAALTETLTAITGMQINVLNAQSSNPNAIVIPLPVFYKEQGAPVQMHISRDAPKGGKLDADNFSIAFILDTRSLGTVSIDVQTAGRMVSVNVKTEGAPAASRFRSTLDDLRGRLQQLRYNVANMSAAVAPHRFGAAPEPAPTAETAPEQRTSSVLDMHA